MLIQNMLIQSKLLSAGPKRESENAPVTTCGHLWEYEIPSWYESTFKQGSRPLKELRLCCLN